MVSRFSGATGVTTVLIQIGTAAGYRVRTTGRTVAKLSFATSLGAECIFDTCNAATITHSLSSPKPGGTVVSCGIHSESTSMEAKTNLLHLFANHITLTGVYTATKDKFVDPMNFVAATGSRPYFGKVLPLERAEEGLRDIW